MNSCNIQKLIVRFQRKSQKLEIKKKISFDKILLRKCLVIILCYFMIVIVVLMALMMLNINPSELLQDIIIECSIDVQQVQ
jgi:hypothetical protein